MVKTLVLFTAIVWIVVIDVYPPMLSDLELFIRSTCINENVPYEMVKRLITKESNWDTQCISYNKKKGRIISTDIGLMQINSRYSDEHISKYKDLKKEVHDYNLFDPYDNITIGIRLLKDLKLRLGTWEKAVQAYNCGATAVLMGKVPYTTKIYTKYVLNY